MESCIYEGWVRHRRFQPVRHEFRNRLFMMYLDLDELDIVFKKRWLWSTNRMAPARFRRRDFMGPQDQCPKESVKDFVEQSGFDRPAGRVCLLANLRYYGYIFNPVAFFYCYDESNSLQYVVAQVTNTPWGEQHCYVITRDQFAAQQAQPNSAKDFHVSPFMPMDLSYCWQVNQPEQQLIVRIANYKQDSPDEPFFDALLNMNRVEITGWSLARMLMRYPFLTAQVLGKIYWQALRLWMKGTPFYPHPRKKTETQEKLDVPKHGTQTVDQENDLIETKE